MILSLSIKKSYTPKIYPDIWAKPFYLLQNTKNLSSSTWNRKYNNHVLINVFQNLLQIKPDIFEELILNNLVLNMSIQIKRKGIPK